MLTGLQLVKKFPTFHETQRFITALTNVRHLSLLYPVYIHTSHLLEIRSHIYIYIYIYIYKQTEIKYRCIKPRFDTDINIHAALTDILVENIYFSFRKCMLQLILFIPAGNNNRKTHHCQLSVRHINVMLHTHTHNTYQ